MIQIRTIALPLALIAFVIFVASSNVAQTRELNLGGLIVSVSDSRTAQVFHIVDQMSQWHRDVHHQYVRWANRTLNLSQEDQQLLQKHAELRRARGWGNGFEQAFYVNDSIEVAAQHAVENKLISAEEAETEKKILLHFVPILSGLLDRSASQVIAFRMRLEAEGRKIAPIVKQLVRFSETKGTAKVPVFLVPNPEEGSGGGGYNGEKLVVEIQTDPDPLPILFHETMHALLRQHKEAINVAAESVGLSWVELNEGLAYAFSPGLIDPQGPNSLPERIIRNFQGSVPTSDGYARSKKYLIALIIVPILRTALKHGETFRSFLPKVVTKLRTFNWS
jgi:hypothetical protein